MAEAPDPSIARRLETLRLGLRIMARRALGDPDLAEEVTQETLTRTLDALRDGRLAQPEKLGAFARGIAGHVIADLIRERKRTARLDPASEVASPLTRREDDALEALVTAETEEKVRKALMGLSEADRELLRLSYFEDLKPAAVAARLGKPASRIRMRKSRALARLKRVFLRLSGRYESAPGATTQGKERETGPVGGSGAENR